MHAVSLELEILGRHQHPDLTVPFLKVNMHDFFVLHACFSDFCYLLFWLLFEVFIKSCRTLIPSFILSLIWKLSWSNIFRVRTRKAGESCSVAPPISGCSPLEMQYPGCKPISYIPYVLGILVCSYAKHTCASKL